MQQFTNEQGNLLIELARKRIENILNNISEFDTNPYKSEEWLMENGAVFVTLTINDELRGCIGSLEAYRPLITDLLEHARHAAFTDPRFNPLTIAEFAKVKIEISVLTPRQEVNYTDESNLKNKIRPKIDGVYLTYNDRGATFLPQVWEELPSFDLFFRHLCLKAGVSDQCIKSGSAKIETYQVQKFKQD